MRILINRQLRLLTMCFLTCISFNVNAETKSSHHKYHKVVSHKHSVKVSATTKTSHHKHPLNGNATTKASHHKHTSIKANATTKASYHKHTSLNANATTKTLQYTHHKYVSHELASQNVKVTTIKPHHEHYKYHKFVSHKHPQNAWFIGIGGGASFSGFPSGTSVSNGSGFTPPSDMDAFTINNPTAAMWQFLIGYKVHREQKFLPYFSTYFQYRHTINSSIKGTVDQYSLPEFLNYNYQMNYDSDLYMLVGKFNLFECHNVLPYVTGGIGVQSNHLNHYTETALPSVTPRDNPGFGGNTSDQAAFSLGAGLDYMITDNVWMTLGYEHIFANKIETDTGIGSWSDTTLNFGNMQNNVVFLNVTANITQG